jgi:DNA polymerase III alpha subunit
MEFDFGILQVKIDSPELSKQLTKLTAEATIAVENWNKAFAELVEFGKTEAQSQKEEKSDDDQNKKTEGPKNIPIDQDTAPNYPNQNPQQNQRKPAFENVDLAAANFQRTMDAINAAGGIEALQTKLKVRPYEFKVVLSSGNSVEYNVIKVEGAIPEYIDDVKLVKHCYIKGKEVSHEVFRGVWLKAALEILKANKSV